MPIDVADFATFSKRYVAIIARDSGSAHRYVPAMLDKWLLDLLDRHGVSQAELGRRLSAKLGRKIDRSVPNKMCNGTREISAYELAAILEIFDEPNPLSGRDLSPKALLAARLFERLMDADRQDSILRSLRDSVQLEALSEPRPVPSGSDGKKGR